MTQTAWARENRELLGDRAAMARAVALYGRRQTNMGLGSWVWKCRQQAVRTGQPETGPGMRGYSMAACLASRYHASKAHLSY